MRHPLIHARRLPGSARGALLGAALLLAVALVTALGATTTPTAQADAGVPAVTTLPVCQTHLASRHIYDCAGLLTTEEVSALEAKAQAAQRAGAPVVVFLQAKDASYDQTLQDAADLMARWDVESQPGAKDGLVILLNLKPGDLRHGQVALYAGATLLAGALPQDELSRIYQDVMLPRLAAGQTAAGIGAGLDAAATDLRAGHPVTPPPAGQGVARAIGTIPLNIAAALLLLASLALGLTAWRRSQQRPAQALAPTAPPSQMLAPAVAGALVTGSVGGAQMQATILDFARRGLLALEPVSPRQAQIRLLSDGRGLTGYERVLWQVLAAQAAPEGIIPAERMYHVTTSWQPAMDALRDELLGRGWFDGERGRKRAPLIVVMVISLALAVVGVILGALAQQPWPFIAAGVSLIAGCVALGFMLAIPALTPLGDEMAQGARNYFAGLRANLPGANIGDALPWLVGAGLASAFAQRLRAASAQSATDFVAIYPIWLLAASSMTPPAAATSSVVATGAAVGGGGAGGAF
ncbi:MAG TPA: TPM domain-containing protein [Ktedonobacterales bacterium]|nr:TPM domain-containing protein [Ktedonobacterales bacterium]